jgi:phosphofructokinase-like protein
MRVAIMTGGGDCPGLNAVIRAAVKVGIEKHGFEIFGVEDAFAGLVDLEYRSPDGNRWLTARDVRGVLSRGGTILGTSNRSDPFHYVVETESGKEVETDVSDRVMENFRKTKLDALVSIGGDGSMLIAHRFLEKGLPIVGVPKTIDNDLGGTDQTFGFDTAVEIATEAIDRLRDTAESHDRVMIVEVMGRDAGWIALHAGIAGGADAILIPEIPYRPEPIAAMIQRRHDHGQKYSLIVVSEGARPQGGEASIGERKLGAMPRLMGAAQLVAESIRPHLKTTKADLRVTVLGHLLATRFGRAAIELVAAKDFGKMVALRDGAIVAIPMADALRRQKLVEPTSELVATARAVGTTFGDV